MNDSLLTSVTTVLLAVIGVGFLSVLLSKNSQTARVISAGGAAFNEALGAAVSPVTGGFSAVL